MMFLVTFTEVMTLTATAPEKACSMLKDMGIEVRFSIGVPVSSASFWRFATLQNKRY